MKPLAYILIGATAATTLVLACSDDSPADADAAVCDCPAAEPPVPARIVTIRSVDQVVTANGAGGIGVACPTASKFLSGGCYVDAPGVNDLQLHSFGKVADQESFGCTWFSHHAADQTVHAEVTCLVP